MSIAEHSFLEIPMNIDLICFVSLLLNMPLLSSLKDLQRMFYLYVYLHKIAYYTHVVNWLPFSLL